jgi:NAD(P)H dehydrogenase (quinone)
VGHRPQRPVPGTGRPADAEGQGDRHLQQPGVDGRCGYLTIDELAYAFARMATGQGHGGQTYNLVGECLTQAELVALANQTFGMQVRYVPMTDDESVARFLRLMPERGEAVARMLTGAFQCIRAGAFAVPSDFAAAAGRSARSMAEMFADCRRKLGAA